MGTYPLSKMTLRYDECPTPSPFSARWSRSRASVSQSPLLAAALLLVGFLPNPSTGPLAPSLFRCLSLSSFEPWTDGRTIRAPCCRLISPTRRRPTPRRPSPAPQSQVNTAASARRCVYQLSCLVPPSKLPNRRQRQPAAIFLRPAAAAARPPPCTRRPITAVGFGCLSEVS